MRPQASRVHLLTAACVGALLTGGLGSVAAPATAGVTRVVPDRPSTVSLTAPARRVHRAGHFRVATFNVLGYSHTRNGGRGMAGGVRRMVWTRRLLNRHSIDVAGFQELQAPQVRKLRALTHHRWGLYPGFRLGPLDSENSVGWRKSKFRLVSATTVNIPYFDGQPRAMPVVLLRHRRSGMLTYFSNFHNPAETGQFRHQQHWRRVASQVEIALQRQLVHRGIPRIMTGDMNEHGPYFCRVTRHGTPLKAARPGSRRVHGVCHPGHPPFVDWIFGSLRLTFRNYFEAWGPLTRKTSDHPMIMADVTVRPSRMPRGWARTPPPPFVPRVSYRR